MSWIEIFQNIAGVKLWHSLYDLKSIADDLWTEANEFNLWKFSHQLKKTIDEVEKSCLFIEENHHQELKKLLEQFSEYRFGKTKVIQFNKNRGTESFDREATRSWISHNKERKMKYEELINEIRRDLKKQIRGDR